MLHSLSKVQNLKDPLKMFDVNWVISFPSGSPLTNLIKTEDLELRCQAFGFPTLTGDKTEVDWGGFHRVYAGKQTRQGEWTVTFTEVWDSTITEAMKVWLNMYHNYKNGTISLLDAYTATVNVALLNPEVYEPKPEGMVRYDLRLYDVFPTNISFPNIEASSSNPIEITGTFNYNYFLMGDEID
jgi:hypothetical protein